MVTTLSHRVAALLLAGASLASAQFHSSSAVLLLAGAQFASANRFGGDSPGAACAAGQRCAISASTGCYDGSMPGLTPIVQTTLEDEEEPS